VITDSTIRSAAGHKEVFDAWSALTAEEKVSLLKKLIDANISEATPLLFKGN
jgi:hypothetical protein